jgi:hypothetical protein
MSVIFLDVDLFSKEKRKGKKRKEKREKRKEKRENI